MTKQTTQKYLQRLALALQRRQGKAAFDQLHTLLSSLQNWQLQEKLQSLEGTYKTMLHYVAQNIRDPHREKIYAELTRSLFQIADDALYRLNTANNNTLFYEKKRSAHFYIPETVPQLLDQWNVLHDQITLAQLLENAPYSLKLQNLIQDKQTAASKLFLSVWLSDPWTNDDKNIWTPIFQAPPTDGALPNLIVTALTLNLLELFDEKKALLLFEASQNPDASIQHRALTGILLFLRKYDYRIEHYPSLRERLHQLAENLQNIRAIRNILLQFILSRETEKITHKINSELIPELMKKINTDDKTSLKPADWMIDPASLNEKNPEWETFIEQSGLQDQFREISELQMQGADVMHSSFIHLKNYPFFNEPAHWFLPFSTPPNPDMDADLQRLAQTLAASTLLCNSDKYSFYYSILQMPASYRQMMVTQFSAESESAREIQQEELQTDAQTIDPATRHYIQDLYRFYKLHPNHNDFEDIFKLQPEFYKIPTIRQLIPDDQSLLLIAEYYFNKNYFEEANDLFDILLQSEPANDVLHQKKAYALQMTGHLQDALLTYQKAELLSPNHSWTIKKLANLHRLLKNPTEALFYYKKAEQLNPDNLAIQLSIGHCLLELKEYEQALKYYFKVEYLSPNKEKAWRPIAWTSFRHGKHQQAADYFNRLLAAQPNPTDYLNAGHVQLALRNTSEALRLYRLALQTGEQSPADFFETFRHDVPALVEAGIEAEDIPFLVECVFYG